MGAGEGHFALGKANVGNKAEEEKVIECLRKKGRRWGGLPLIGK